ncbi:hypothetical protein J6590_089520 [Homalodisca vitripennis]|nr:hypothetical protein J6590_089520 [Homalodisca vitripennis]
MAHFLGFPIPYCATQPLGTRVSTEATCRRHVACGTVACSTVYFKSGNTLRHTNATLCYKNTVCRTLLPLSRQRWMSAAVDGRHGVESAFYKDRNIKCDKLKELAIKYDCSVTDLKKKIKNLRSAFHREHKRITKPKSGSSPKKEKWFAYNLLKFLLDVDIPRETFSTAENSEVS